MDEDVLFDANTSEIRCKPNAEGHHSVKLREEYEHTIANLRHQIAQMKTSAAEYNATRVHTAAEEALQVYLFFSRDSYVLY